jgi:hypothetical protein
MDYVRFQSAYPGVKGFKAGVFVLVNALGMNGMLTPDEERFRRENNAWYNQAYPAATTHYAQHPKAVAWFKDSSSELLERIPGYLAILDAHRIAWEEARTASPGVIVYEDAWQVLAVAPLSTAQSANQPDKPARRPQKLKQRIYAERRNGPRPRAHKAAPTRPHSHQAHRETKRETRPPGQSAGHNARTTTGHHPRSRSTTRPGTVPPPGQGKSPHPAGTGRLRSVPAFLTSPPQKARERGQEHLHCTTPPKNNTKTKIKINYKIGETRKPPRAALTRRPGFHVPPAPLSRLLP